MIALLPRSRRRLTHCKIKASFYSMYGGRPALRACEVRARRGPALLYGARGGVGVARLAPRALSLVRRGATRWLRARACLVARTRFFVSERMLMRARACGLVRVARLVACVRAWCAAARQCIPLAVRTCLSLCASLNPRSSTRFWLSRTTCCTCAHQLFLSRWPLRQMARSSPPCPPPPPLSLAPVLYIQACRPRPTIRPLPYQWPVGPGRE